MQNKEIIDNSPQLDKKKSNEGNNEAVLRRNTDTEAEYFIDP